ncbi:hypothetical protein Palpr_2369 [Paludibacter propionicigenes WB4]|uniref:Uncharacterized protein n=2 Tax=Paludibacter TaxID=346096 RepID=E4T708_PALPW|nr:hypothetical protein Palpr_2369 [Paludibacter propionicigenes WB4]
MTTGLIIGLIVLISAFGFYSCKGKDKSSEKYVQPEKVTVTKVNENPYPGLRTQAINVTAEQLKLKLDDDKAVYGIAMDWNMGNAIITVFSFTTGDASVYISTGQVLIGGYAHETVVDAAKEFVKIGENYISIAKKTDKIEPTNESKVDFYLLTKSGKYYIEDDLTLIQNGKSELSKLFEAGNKVITEYRLIADKK